MCGRSFCGDFFNRQGRQERHKDLGSWENREGAKDAKLIAKFKT
jgi:hypothetical protein